MAWSHLSDEQSNPGGSGSSVGMSPAVISVGDLVIVTARAQDDVTIDSCGDTLGNNIYTALGPATTNAGPDRQRIRGFFTVAAVGGNSPTVLVQFSGSTAGLRRIYINRFAATGIISTDGYSADAALSVSPVDPGPVATTGASGLLFGGGMESSSPWTMDAAFTDADAGGNHRFGYRINVGATTYRYQPTFANTDSWCAYLAAFKEVAAVAAPFLSSFMPQAPSIVLPHFGMTPSGSVPGPRVP